MTRLKPLPLIHQQRGVALMIVILIFALVSLLSVGMHNRQKTFIQSASSVSAMSQAYEYAMGSEIYARRLLKDDWDNDKSANEFVDGLDQVSNAIVLPVDQAALEAQFNDMHGRLNINDLVDVGGSPNALMRERFEALFSRLALDTLTVDLLQDWIDDNQDVSGIDGAEDGEYLNMAPAYRSASQPFMHSSELLALLNVDQKEIELLRPHVSMLPRGWGMTNVNTASAEVLQSIVKDLPDADAERLVEQLQDTPWKSLQEFGNDPVFKGKTIDQTNLSVYSNFFEVATRITLNERKVRLRSVILRNQSDGSMQVIQRDQGQKYLITKEKLGL
jgi:general secretion pathway protein K